MIYVWGLRLFPRLRVSVFEIDAILVQNNNFCWMNSWTWLFYGVPWLFYNLVCVAIIPLLSCIFNVPSYAYILYHYFCQGIMCNLPWCVYFSIAAIRLQYISIYIPALLCHQLCCNLSVVLLWYVILWVEHIWQLHASLSCY